MIVWGGVDVSVTESGAHQRLGVAASGIAYAPDRASWRDISDDLWSMDLYYITDDYGFLRYTGQWSTPASRYPGAPKPENEAEYLG